MSFSLKPGQIWRAKDGNDEYVYLLVTEILVDFCNDKYCKLVNVESDIKYEMREEKIANKWELVTNDYLP